MKHLLNSLGMTKEEVIEAVKEFSPKEQIPLVVDPKQCHQEPKNYLYAVDQRRIRRRLKNSERFILARYYEGYKPKRIAQMMGVSEESIRSRLRKKNFFGKSNKPGRPKTDLAQSAIQSYSPFHQDGEGHPSLVEIVS